MDNVPFQMNLSEKVEYTEVNGIGYKMSFLMPDDSFEVQETVEVTSSEEISTLPKIDLQQYTRKNEIKNTGNILFLTFLLQIFLDGY